MIRVSLLTQNIILYLSFGLFLVGLTACGDDENSIMATIPSSELWVYELGNQPVEGSYSITKQAEHAIRSEIEMSPDGIGMSYYYMSEAGYMGTDAITIESCWSPGDNNFQCSNIYLVLDVR